MKESEKWEAWHKERKAFESRETEGFTKDLEALKQHILKLQHLAPKDQARWPSTDALIIIDKLQREYKQALSLIETVFSKPDSL